ncbi:hypothetical protein [Pseudonocardia alni]|uniref:Nuclease-like protein n=1 Tax=Pseudonocardia alni subsp. carboxydivorans TaxID=415010 RepID=A0ABU9AJN5_PSEA5
MSDEEFRQVVRRYPPSLFVPLVAAIGSEYVQPHQWMRSPYKKFTPWAIAEVARASLVYGNEHRSDRPDSVSVLRACAAYVAVTDPDLAHHQQDAFWKFISRVSYEQLRHQVPIFNELGRSVRLFGDDLAQSGAEVMRASWQSDLFGCSVVEYVATAFLVHVGAAKNSGTFSLDWLNQPNFVDVTAEISSDLIRAIVLEQFTADASGIRHLNSKTVGPLPHRDLRRHRFNPLEAKPVISGLGPSLIVPSCSMLMRKVSSSGIYFSGIQRWGDAFARDLGHRFEVYIGKQLRLLRHAQVSPAVRFDRGRRESVDWFAVFSDVVLLVEVKSTRSTEALRVGGDPASPDLRRILGKAVRQIEATARQISNGAEEFGHIPNDRPLVGVIVTLEPVHAANAARVKSELDQISVPYTVCSASELEDVVCCESVSVGSRALSLVSDPAKDGWSLHAELQGEMRRKNPIVSAAWAELPWAREGEVGADNLVD